LIVAENNIELRPRFTIDVNSTVDDMVDLLEEELTDSKLPFRKVGKHFFIDIPKKENHFWSPQLQIEVLPKGNKSVLKGLFGPKPQVWTMFMFLHFIIAFLFVVFGILYYVNSSLGKSVFLAICMLVALPVIWIFLYALGRIGRSTGNQQMNQLKSFLTGVLNEGVA